MAILLLVICIIIGFFLSDKAFTTENEVIYGMLFVDIFAIIGLFIVSVVWIFEYPYNVDAKIEMYQEENQIIETKVKETVRAYMNYEQETYQSLLGNADLTTLMVKYPELNSNELVKMEIDTYKDNSSKIKELKEKRINKRMLGFWLFFNIGQRKVSE